MSYLTMPFVPAFNLLGLIAPDANLKFYLTETTTPADVYADPDLSTSLGAVVNADAFGRFVAIYLDPLVTYRVRLETTLGSLIQEADGITGGGSAANFSFLQSGTGAVPESVQAALRRLPLFPEQFGAVGSGADDTAPLTEVLAESVATGRTAVISQVFSVGDLTIPAGATVSFHPGGMLEPLGSDTLTIDGYIEAGLHQIFAAGWIFTRTDIFNGFQDVPLEWFGGQSSFATKPDCLAAFNYAIDFCKSVRSRNILLDTGIYYTSATIVIDGLVGVRGKGWNCTLLQGKSTMTAGTYVFDFQGTEPDNFTNIDLMDMQIRSETAGRVHGIKSVWFAHVNATRLHFYECNIGLDLFDTSYSWRLRDCFFYNNTVHAILGEQSNNTLISGCQLVGGTTGIRLTGTSNSITICDETNFEAISGRPIEWSGAGVFYKLTVRDSRFEKCVGDIRRTSGTALMKDFSYKNNFADNSDGTTAQYFYLEDCDGVKIADNYFGVTTTALLNVQTSSTSVAIEDNICVSIPKMNGATGGGDVGAGYTACRGYNNGAAGVQITGSAVHP